MGNWKLKHQKKEHQKKEQTLDVSYSRYTNSSPVSLSQAKT